MTISKITLFSKSRSFWLFSWRSLSLLSCAFSCLAWKRRRVSGKVVARDREGLDNFWCNWRARPGCLATKASNCSNVSIRSAQDRPKNTSSKLVKKKNEVHGHYLNSKNVNERQILKEVERLNLTTNDIKDGSINTQFWSSSYKLVKTTWKKINMITCTKREPVRTPSVCHHQWVKYIRHFMQNNDKMNAMPMVLWVGKAHIYSILLPNLAKALPVSFILKKYRNQCFYNYKLNIKTNKNLWNMNFRGFKFNNQIFHKNTCIFMEIYKDVIPPIKQRNDNAS